MHAKANSPTPLYPQNQEALALFHAELSLVSTVANQVGRTLAGLVDRSDLLNSGREGLFQAACRYDKRHNIPFRFYAHARVRGAMLDHVRTACLPRQRHRITNHSGARTERTSFLKIIPFEHALDEDPASDHPTPTLAARTLDSELTQAMRAQSGTPEHCPESLVARAEALARVRETLSSFPNEERELMRRHYFEHEDFRTIARELRVDPSRVSRVHARALKRLVKRMRRRLSNSTRAHAERPLAASTAAR